MQCVDYIFQDLYEEVLCFFLYYGDLIDSFNLICIMVEVWLDEVYNLGVQLYVVVSFEVLEYIVDVDGLGVLWLLEVIWFLGLEGYS